MTHDELFKQVLRGFLSEFMHLFFPAMARELNLKRARFLDKELLPTMGRTRKRIADLVAEIPMLRQPGVSILLHVEIELRRRKSFAHRMFRYYCLLSEQWTGMILPIAVYLRSRGGVGWESYRRRTLRHSIMEFNYAIVGLATLHAQRYAHSAQKNVLAWALAALMRKPRDRDLRLVLRVQCLRAILNSELSDEDKLLLWNVIETYWELSDDERIQFEQLLSKEPYAEVKRMQVTWADKLIKQGIEQGIEQGLLKGKQDDLLRLLRRKFGRLPASVRAAINEIDSVDRLNELLDMVLVAESLSDMGLDEVSKNKVTSRRKKKTDK